MVGATDDELAGDVDGEESGETEREGSIIVDVSSEWEVVEV